MGLGNAWGVRLPCTEDISGVQIPGAPLWSYSMPLSRYTKRHRKTFGKKEEVAREESGSIHISKNERGKSNEE